MRYKMTDKKLERGEGRGKMEEGKVRGLETRDNRAEMRREK